MDHADARELIELASVEPGGLDRLMAGDTAVAAAVAGHVAGCPECADEVGRLRRAASVIRRAIRTMPPDDLRDRTLAYVAQVGRPRGVAAAPMAVAGLPAGGGASGADRRPEASADIPAPVGGGAAPGVAVAPAAGRGRRSWRPAAWAATLAAAVVLSVMATGLYLNNRINEQNLAIAGLAQSSAWTMRLSEAPGTQRVELSGPGGAAGSLLYSQETDELVVVATGISEPGEGLIMRCWAEQDGERIRLGRMYFGAGVAYWSGKVEALDRIRSDAVFGVSADRVGDTVGSDPVLSGRL